MAEPARSLLQVETVAEQWPGRYGLYLTDGDTPFLHDEPAPDARERGEYVDDAEMFVRRAWPPSRVIRP